MTASRLDMIRAAHRRYLAREVRVERTVARVEERMGDAHEDDTLAALVAIFAPTAATREVLCG